MTFFEWIGYLLLVEAFVQGLVKAARMLRTGK